MVNVEEPTGAVTGSNETKSPCLSKTSINCDAEKQSNSNSRASSPTTTSLDDINNQPQDHSSPTSITCPPKPIPPSLDSYLPEFGYKVPLDYVFPKKWSPYFRVRFHQMLPFIPLGIR